MQQPTAPPITYVTAVATTAPPAHADAVAHAAVQHAGNVAMKHAAIQNAVAAAAAAALHKASLAQTIAPSSMAMTRVPRASAPLPGQWTNLTAQIDAAIAAQPPPLVNAQPVLVPATAIELLPSTIIATAKSPAAAKPPAKRLAKRVHKQTAQPQAPFIRPNIFSTENPAPGLVEANISLTHGDCVEGMKQLAAASVDLVIADPPYDIGVGKAAWDTVPNYLKWSRTWIAECVRVLKPGGALMIYGSPEKLWICHLKIMCAEEFGLDFKQHISWCYKQGGDSRMNNMVKYAVRMEHLEWFTKPGAEHTFNIDAGTEQYSEADKLEALAKGVGRVTEESLNRGKPPKNWWDIPRENSRSKEREYGSHPSMKPLRICDRVVGIHSNLGDTVLVPFGGSGSECVAIGMGGRKLIAYEKENEYHRIITRRLKGWGLLSGPPTPPPAPASEAELVAEPEAGSMPLLPMAAAPFATGTLPAPTPSPLRMCEPGQSAMAAAPMAAVPLAPIVCTPMPMAPAVVPVEAALSSGSAPWLAAPAAPMPAPTQPPAPAQAVAPAASASGAHPRPRGRAPSGKAWDSATGRWVDAPADDAPMAALAPAPAAPPHQAMVQVPVPATHPPPSKRPREDEQMTLSQSTAQAAAPVASGALIAALLSGSRQQAQWQQQQLWLQQQQQSQPLLLQQYFLEQQQQQQQLGQQQQQQLGQQQQQHSASAREPASLGRLDLD